MVKKRKFEGAEKKVVGPKKKPNVRVVRDRVKPSNGTLRVTRRSWEMSMRQGSRLKPRLRGERRVKKAPCLKPFLLPKKGEGRKKENTDENKES